MLFNENIGINIIFWRVNCSDHIADNIALISIFTNENINLRPELRMFSIWENINSFLSYAK